MFTSKVCFMKIDENVFEVRTKSAVEQVLGDARKQGSKTDKQARGVRKQKNCLRNFFVSPNKFKADFEGFNFHLSRETRRCSMSSALSGSLKMINGGNIELTVTRFFSSMI